MYGYDYYSDEPADWPEEQEDDDRCFDCGASGDEACMDDCATRRLATQDDLEELSYSSPDPEPDWSKEDEAWAYAYGVTCAGLEMAGEWA